MNAPRLLHRIIRGGVYEGLLAGPSDAPAIELRLDGRAIARPTLEAADGMPGAWAMRATIPGTVLSEGVQAVTLVECDAGTVLDSFTVSAGDPQADDLRAEIALLRAELDLLKAAFRRHCSETGG